MSPPTYSDIGKDAADILYNAFHFCWWKFICNTMAKGIELNTNGYCQEGSNDPMGIFDVKYYYDLINSTLFGRYTSTNILGLGIETPSGCILKNLQLDYSYELGPTFDGKRQKIKLAYGLDFLQFDSNILLDHKGIYSYNSAVFQLGKLLFGYKVNFDVTKDKLDYHKFALGWITKDFSITLNVSDTDQDFLGTVHKRLNKEMEMAFFGSMSNLTGAWKLGIGGKYLVNEDNIIHCLVMTPLLFGVSFQRRLSEYFTVLVSALIDVNKFKFKVGASFELDLTLEERETNEKNRNAKDRKSKEKNRNVENRKTNNKKGYEYVNPE